MGFPYTRSISQYRLYSCKVVIQSACIVCTPEKIHELTRLNNLQISFANTMKIYLIKKLGTKYKADYEIETIITAQLVIATLITRLRQHT